MLVSKSPVNNLSMIVDKTDRYLIIDNTDSNKPVPNEVANYIYQLIKNKKINWSTRKVSMNELSEMEKLRLLPKSPEIKNIKINYSVIDCSNHTRGLSTLYEVVYLKLI